MWRGHAGMRSGLLPAVGPCGAVLGQIPSSPPAQAHAPLPCAPQLLGAGPLLQVAAGAGRRRAARRGGRCGAGRVRAAAGPQPTGAGGQPPPTPRSAHRAPLAGPPCGCTAGMGAAATATARPRDTCSAVAQLLAAGRLFAAAASMSAHLSLPCWRPPRVQEAACGAAASLLEEGEPERHMAPYMAAILQTLATALQVGQAGHASSALGGVGVGG